MRSLFIALSLIASAPQCVFADDFGPRGDVHEIRFVTQRLLTHRARAMEVDPNNIRLSGVVVVKDGALLSWDIGANHGLMGLVRQNNRWWDALDMYLGDNCSSAGGAAASYPLPGNWSSFRPNPTAASLLSYGLPADLVAESKHNTDVRASMATPPPIIRTSTGNVFQPHCDIATYEISNRQRISPKGNSLVSSRSDTSGYEIHVRYGANNSRDSWLRIPYARPPTPAEFLPYPTTFRFLSTAVLYFDLTIDGSAPVKFQPGTTIDIWFPFVLDETLKYDLTIGFADEPIGPIYATPMDNVLHYTLPGFTATPGRSLMAEIDGNWP